MHKDKNIALIGFRGTGKTFLGKMLAQKMGRLFVDMDDRLADSLGMSIQEWVSQFGWESFREAESKVLKELAGEHLMVLATGGGVILSQQNRNTLKKHFTTIWLQANPETIHQRLLGDPRTVSQRPALTELSPEEEIVHLLAERTPLYGETAHFQLSTDTESPIASVSRILAFLEATPT